MARVSNETQMPVAADDLNGWPGSVISWSIAMGASLALLVAISAQVTGDHAVGLPTGLVLAGLVGLGSVGIGAFWGHERLFQRALRLSLVRDATVRRTWFGGAAALVFVSTAVFFTPVADHPVSLGAVFSLEILVWSASLFVVVQRALSRQQASSKIAD